MAPGAYLVGHDAGIRPGPIGTTGPEWEPSAGSERPTGIHPRHREPQARGWPAPFLRVHARDADRASSRPGGRVVLIAESYRTGTVDLGHRLAMMLLRAPHLTVDEHREWFSSAGFSDVQVFEERGKRWICVTGTRPSSAQGGSERPSSEPV